MTRWIPLEKVERNAHNVITVGTFDGVHAGHRQLIQRLIRLARQSGATSTVVTFDPHPREVIHPDQGRHLLLTTMEERAELLGECGVDQMIVIPFDRAMSLMDSETFLEKVLYERIGCSQVLIGFDHHFGRDREGSIDTVRRLGQRLGFVVEEFPEQDVHSEKVSSSRIRKALSESGDVELARTLLGRPYRLSGTVIRGDGRGRKLGFPTANLRLNNPRKVRPASGVYAVEAHVRGERHAGMMNIGQRPTFDATQTTMEVHILDLQADLYGVELRIDFLHRIRDERRFESVEALVAQLHRDRARTQEVFRGYGASAG